MAHKLFIRIILLAFLMCAGRISIYAQQHTDSTKFSISGQLKKIKEMDSQWKNDNDSIAESSTNMGKLIQKSLKRTYDGNYKGLDTNYISLPEHPFLVSFSFDGQYFKHDVHTPSSFNTSRTSVNTDMAYRIGLNASYRGAGLGFNFTVGDSKRQYMSLTYYHKRLGVEFVMQSMDDVPAVFENGRSTNASSNNFGNLDISTLKLHAFFVINNHRKFSYPSVLTYSTVQKRTAGGFFASATYFHSSTDAKRPSASQTETSKSRFKIKSDHIALGGGYGINVVPSQGRIVLHASVNPVLLISFNNTTDTMVGPIIRPVKAALPSTSASSSQRQGKAESKTDWNFNVQFRLAAVYNINQHFVIGLNAYHDNFRTSHTDMFRASTTETTISAKFGVRF